MGRTYTHLTSLTSSLLDSLGFRTCDPTLVRIGKYSKLCAHWEPEKNQIFRTGWKTNLKKKNLESFALGGKILQNNGHGKKNPDGGKNKVTENTDSNPLRPTFRRSRTVE